MFPPASVSALTAYSGSPLEKVETEAENEDWEIVKKDDISLDEEKDGLSTAWLGLKLVDNLVQDRERARLGDWLLDF